MNVSNHSDRIIADHRDREISKIAGWGAKVKDEDRAGFRDLALI